ncbi:MAG: hypothetical protein EB125_02255, partial [Betaproteobacteria bacterium]|nr:hypothetical protein [Betaproteobacteria bacterium]
LGAGEVVNVYREGTLLGTATVAPNGTTWTFTDTTAYAGGNNTASTPSAGWTYTAKVVDATGNSGIVATTQVYLDTTEAAPVITGVTDSASASIANNGTTTNTLSTVSGTGVAGDIIYLYDNTGTNLVGSTTVANDGTWAITGLATNLSVGAGSNAFSASQLDPQGNLSALSNVWTVSAAAANILTNGGFTGGLTGWTTTGAGTQNFSSYTSNTLNDALIFNGSDQGAGGSASQVLATQAGQTYAVNLGAGQWGLTSSHTIQVDILGSSNQVISTQTLVLSTASAQSLSFNFVATGSSSTLRITNTSVTNTVGSDAWVDSVSVKPQSLPSDGSLVANTTTPGTSGPNTLTYKGGPLDTLAGNDTITATTSIQSQLAAGGIIKGGAGVDTLRLAAGTTLNLAALTNNQTVTPLQEVEIIEMQGSSSVLSMTANNVLSLGGSHASTMSSYNFASVTNPQGGGTNSTGKVQMVVLGNTGDVLNLQGLANDGITGTGVNAGIFGNSNLAGSWSYKGDVVLGGVTYKVYDHSTTQAQVLAKVDVTVNTLTPIAITSIVDNATSSADTGVSATDFVTSDTTLTYKGTMPVLAGGEKVRVKILDSSNAVIYEGDATLNGTNWTFDRTSTALAAGNYTIQAQIVDSSNNPVGSYGALGTATGPLKIDTGSPTIAVTASGSGNTRTVTFTLSEASTTFDATDVDVTNGQLSNFAADTTSGTAASGYTRYTATFTATSGFSGTATVGVLNNKFSDIAGNTNQDTYAASPTSPVVNDGNNQVSFTVDGVPPTVAISSNQLYLNSTTNTATITFTFSEAVVQGSATNQFDLSDVVFSGGTLTGLTPVNGTGDVTNGYTQYTATFTAATNSTADGFVGIQNGKFADATGNLNKDTYVAGVTGAVQESDNALTMPVNTTGTVQVFGINGGGTEFTQSGFDLHGIGDVNGDGKEDFMIATRGAINGATVIEAAKTYVVFGKDGLNLNGLNLTSLQTAGNGNGFVINGVSMNNYYAATHGAGNYDYNGDGLADIVMNNFNDGKSYVVYGKTNTNPINLSTGFQASDGFTIAVPSGSVYSTPVGDMNGDGFTDTFMAVNNGGYVLYGTSANTNVTIPSGQTGSSAMGFFVHASNLNTLSIVRAPVVGDFNGDGYSDFAVQESNGNSTGGALNVVFGGPSNIANLVAGDSNASGQIGKAGVGFQVTGFTRVDPGLGIPGTKSGDVNGDGLTDLIINNQTKSYSTNSVFVAFGKTDTAAVTTAELSSGTSTKGFRIFNSNFNSGGIEGDVDVVGDFNGDGLADLVVTNTDIYNVNGGAWLVYGKTTGTTIDLATINATDGFKIMKDTPDPLWGYNNWNGGNWNELGFAVAAAGDVNGDGFADLIVSNPHKDTTAASNYKDVGVTYVVYGGQFPSGSPTVFSAAQGDALGTANNDTLTGTSGNNQIVAGAGDDTITGGGGADALYGGAGNDTFVINASNVTAFANTTNTSQGVMKVDGGTGLDTLRLDGAGISLNLKTITAADLASVEHIDITGTGSNTLTLSALDVVELGDYNRFNVNPSATDTRKQLMVTGSSDDVLNLGTNALKFTEHGGVTVRFRFPGLNPGESLQLGFVDRETKGIHAGHLCYAILSQSSSRWMTRNSRLSARQTTTGISYGAHAA